MSEFAASAGKRALDVVFAIVFATFVSNMATVYASAETASLTESRKFVFNIPVQSLTTALEAYTSVTGVETLYSSAIAHEHRSTLVQGKFTASSALRVLLSGTPLSARAIAEEAVTIELPSGFARSTPDSTSDKSAHRPYYSLIQAGLERAFCTDDHLHPGSYRAVLSFNIDGNGQIRQPSLVGTTGNVDRDRVIPKVLEGISIGAPPPVTLQQPLVIVILPETSGHVMKCSSVN